MVVLSFGLRQSDGTCDGRRRTFWSDGEESQNTFYSTYRPNSSSKLLRSHRSHSRKHKQIFSVRVFALGWKRWGEHKARHPEDSKWDISFLWPAHHNRHLWFCKCTTHVLVGVSGDKQEKFALHTNFCSSWPSPPAGIYHGVTGGHLQVTQLMLPCVRSVPGLKPPFLLLLLLLLCSFSFKKEKKKVLWSWETWCNVTWTPDTWIQPFWFYREEIIQVFFLI